VPKILKMPKRDGYRNSKGKAAPDSSSKPPPAEIIQLPHDSGEYADHPAAAHWLKLADQALGNVKTRKKA